MFRWISITTLVVLSPIGSFAQSLAERTRQVLDLVLTQNYEAFYDLFSPEMKKAVTLETCSRSFDQFRALGIPKSIGDPTVQTVEGSPVVTISIHWSAVSLNFRVSWNSRGKVQGYFFLPLTPEPVTSTAPDDSKAGAVTEREITFEGLGGLSLDGTLLLPTGKGKKVPGVLLLPGSGPTDRNGNQPPILMSDLLKQIAARLASDGYASLRFDKRAAATNAAAWPADVAAQNDFFSWDAFVGDAKAALRFLQSQPDVDAARTIIVGHSEGATIAIEIGRGLAGKPSAPAGLVLLSCPGRPGGAVIREQVAAGLKRAGMAEAAARTYTDYVDAAIDQIVKGGSAPPNGPPGLDGLFPSNATRLLQVELSFDPAKVLPVFPGPVLVVQGAKDIQVSKLRDFPLLVAALKSRGGAVESIIVPSASHNLKAVADENTEPGITGPVVPQALDAIASWMKTQFASKP